MNSISLFLCLLFISFVFSDNPIPTNEWESDTVDLGNGGDKTFYTLVKCKDCTKPPPLFIWLAGGPGESSLVSLFVETGPRIINNKTYEFDLNAWAWTNHVDVMYIDNPVAVGFSIAKDQSTMCLFQNCVARNLYTMLKKFIDTHPEYKKRPIYLSGESYAGHFCPAFGEYIIRANNPDIQLAGMGIGNGMYDIWQEPPYYPEYLLENKLIEKPLYLLLKLGGLLCQISGKLWPVESGFICALETFFVADYVGIPNPYDITSKGSDPKFFKTMIDYINSTSVKSAFNVQQQNYLWNNDDVLYAMAGDFGVSYANSVGYVLNAGKKVIMWFGDTDYVCNYIGGKKMSEEIIWDGQEQFKSSELKPWLNDKGVEIGKVKEHGKLKYIRVYGGGHAIFTRQRPSGLQLLLDLIKD